MNNMEVDPLARVHDDDLRRHVVGLDEIAGGIAGLQKLLVKMAEQNRGLDHAALKELIDAHELVMAVYQAEGELSSPPGLGFLTLKGTEHLLAQIKQHRTKKTRATMTAIWCNNREHAELVIDKSLKRAYCDPERELHLTGFPASRRARASQLLAEMWGEQLTEEQIGDACERFMQWSEWITDSAVKDACARELDEDAQLVSAQDIKLVC